MATVSKFNPLEGREKDVLLMCEHFLEDDHIKDSPEVYHAKKLILAHAVHVLKCLFNDSLEVEHVSKFLSNADVRDFALQLFKIKSKPEEQELLTSLKKYFYGKQNAYEGIISELAREVYYLPHH